MASSPLRFTLDGQERHGTEGQPLAVALLAEGERIFSRSIKYHRPRGAFCLAGHCGSCLMRVDGRPNVRACQTPLREGMVAERQNAFPTARHDFLAAADLFFPSGMDHHHLMTSPRPATQLMQSVVRQMGGLGRLPDSVRTEWRAEARHVEVVVVGGGPAGLAAASALAKRGRKVLVVEEQARAGGSYLSHPHFGPKAADAAVTDAAGAGVEILTRAVAVGWYPEDRAPKQTQPGLLLVLTQTGLIQLTADHYVYATGGYDQNLLFANNDRPSVFAGRAVGLASLVHGVRLGAQPLVVAEAGAAAEYAAALAEHLGTKAVLAEDLAAVHGSGKLRAATVRRGKTTARVRCDVVAVCSAAAPASELPRQHGVHARFDAGLGGFACVSSTGNVRVAGDVCGYVGAKAAAEQGRQLGEAL